MEKKYYRLNEKKKTITIDYSVKPTKEDEKEINYYLSSGYIIKRKSAKRSAAAVEMAKKANDGITDQVIMEALKDDEAALKKYESIKFGGGKGIKGKGFFAAKKWYKATYLK